MKTIAITGASGYVGSKILSYFKNEGFRTINLGRKKVEGHENRTYSLNEPVSPKIFEAVDVLIHCAYDFRPLDWPTLKKTNVDGTMELFKKASEAGVSKLIFISSISAFEGCQSLYGRAKLEAENEVLKLGAFVIRPGLVWGEKPGGMVGTLTNVVKKLKWIPVVGSKKQMYTCHEQDLASLIHTLIVKGNSIRKPIIAAAETPLYFRDIIKRLGEKVGQSIFTIPVPWRPLWLLLRTLEFSGRSFGFRSDSLISLMNPDPRPNFETQKDLGQAFRPFGV